MVQKVLSILYKYRVLSLIFAVIICLLGGFAGPKLALRLSLASLLPEDRVSVKQMNNVADYVGGVGYLVTFIGPTESPQQYIEQLTPDLEKISDINYVVAEKEKYTLQDKALYLMSKKDFKTMQKKAKTLFAGEGSSSGPLGLALKPTKEKIDDAKKFFLDFKNNNSPERYFVSKDKKYAMVLLKPFFNSEDIDKSKRLIANTTSALKKHLPKGTPFHFAGRFADKVRDTKQIQDDIGKTGAISLITLAFVLIWGLGSFRSAFVTLLGVVISMGWTTGVAKLLVGQINILTGFLLAILGGLGVEYGIHLIRHYELERKNGKNHLDALKDTHNKMGRTLFSAAVTSSSAFLILSLSDFRGFSELGIIAGFGILSIYITYILCFPLLGFMLRGKPRFAKSRLIFSFYPITIRWTIPILLVAGFILFGISKAEFEFNFGRMHKLSAESTRLNDLSNELFGKSLTPAAILAKDSEQATEIKDWLATEENSSNIKQVISLTSLIPSDMNSRYKKIKKLKKRLEKISDQELKEKTGISPDKIKNWLNTTPYKISELPPQFQSTFGNTGRLVYAFPQQDLDLAPNLIAYTDLMAKVRHNFPDSQIGSDAMVFVEILDHIITDGRLVLILFFISAFIFFWIDFRSFRSAFFLEFQLLFGMAILIGLMGLFNQRFSILNVAMIPAVLAAGIDIGVHLRHRQLEGYAALNSAKHIAQAIQLSVLTTMIGFGALFFAQAGILQGISWISVLGQLSMYLVCMAIVPVLKDGPWDKLTANLIRPRALKEKS